MSVRFALEKIEDENTGQLIESIVQIKEINGKTERDVWCSVLDLDRLFNTCVDRWGSNWNLEKVMTAIRDSEIN